MLLGLKVNGLAISGPSNISWDVVAPIIGSRPTPINERDGKCLRVTWLESYMTADQGPPTVEFAFRVYVLYMIGKVLMPNNSGNLVHLKWLPIVNKTPYEIGQYSWGSAVLATLYRALCDGAVNGCKDIGGCTILLQAWAYSRMTCIAPVPREIQNQNPPLANM